MKLFALIFSILLSQSLASANSGDTFCKVGEYHYADGGGFSLEDALSAAKKSWAHTASHFHGEEWSDFSSVEKQTVNCHKSDEIRWSCTIKGMLCKHN